MEKRHYPVAAVLAILIAASTLYLNSLVAVPAGRPAQSSWFTLSNALTGGAADLYAARSADHTPLTLSGVDGDAQQQWQLVPVSSGSYSLVSRASGKCVVPLGGSAGSHMLMSLRPMCDTP